MRFHNNLKKPGSDESVSKCEILFLHFGFFSQKQNTFLNAFLSFKIGLSLCYVTFFFYYILLPLSHNLNPKEFEGSCCTSLSGRDDEIEVQCCYSLPRHGTHQCWIQKTQVFSVPVECPHFCKMLSPVTADHRCFPTSRRVAEPVSQG